MAARREHLEGALTLHGRALVLRIDSESARIEQRYRVAAGAQDTRDTHELGLAIALRAADRNCLRKRCPSVLPLSLKLRQIRVLIWHAMHNSEGRRQVANLLEFLAMARAWGLR